MGQVYKKSVHLILAGECKEPNWWFNLFFAAKDNLELNYIRIANDSSLDFSLVLFSNVSLAKKFIFPFRSFP